jgi:hypothetical protein
MSKNIFTKAWDSTIKAGFNAGPRSFFSEDYANRRRADQAMKVGGNTSFGGAPPRSPGAGAGNAMFGGGMQTMGPQQNPFGSLSGPTNPTAPDPKGKIPAWLNGAMGWLGKGDNAVNLLGVGAGLYQGHQQGKMADRAMNEEQRRYEAEQAKREAEERKKAEAANLIAPLIAQYLQQRRD